MSYRTLRRSTATTSSTSAAAATTSPATATTVAAAGTSPLAWGFYTPAWPSDLTAVQSLDATAGRSSTYVMWYSHWKDLWSALPTTQLQQLLAVGKTPVITWMSDDTANPSNPAYSNAAIARGAQDTYLRTWALGIKALPGQVVLRLDHEMNGNWYPWAPASGATTARDYVAMWRHVHDVFAKAGVRNVSWWWSPNVSYSGSTALSSLYPGDAYVDLVGLDGYNWGATAGHVWQSPASVFGASVAQVAAVTTRPLMIGEVGCSPVGGDKAAWVQSFFAYLRQTPSIRGFVWFNADKETDWRFSADDAVRSAFATGLATV